MNASIAVRFPSRLSISSPRPYARAALTTVTSVILRNYVAVSHLRVGRARATGLRSLWRCAFQCVTPAQFALVGSPKTVGFVYSLGSANFVLH